MTPQTRTNYIFGYGSLIDRASRISTTPQAWAAYPVIVEGIARGWWSRGTPIGFSTCFLAAIGATGGRCNGVIYPVSPTELEQTDAREAIYERIRIDPAKIIFLDGRRSLPDDVAVWYYSLPSGTSLADNRPSAKYPIVQSYVDICLNGCFDLETLYPLAQEQGFARMFVAETRDWSRYWVNDRPHPRRPFATVPRALQIDALLNDVLPDVFPHIQIHPTNWT
ncbi:MAG TPA: gamma-glutamylcyclotransferase family protein [Ktedonobacterales bacterium]|nr:gamma-glutamylcyclotransferase family protein [Ktedonobacterales bacterium]